MTRRLLPGTVTGVMIVGAAGPVRVDGDTATIGITDYAQDKLTDVVFVELPEVDKTVSSGDPVAVLESVKSVADVYAPLDGTISEGNTELENKPELVNEDAFGAGWIFKMRVSDPDLSGLMDSDAYQTFTDGLED